MSYFEYYNKASLELEEQLRRSFSSDELSTMECQVILRPDSKVLAVATDKRTRAFKELKKEIERLK